MEKEISFYLIRNIQHEISVMIGYALAVERAKTSEEALRKRALQSESALRLEKKLVEFAEATGVKVIGKE